MEKRQELVFVQMMVLKYRVVMHPFVAENSIEHSQTICYLITNLIVSMEAVSEVFLDVSKGSLRSRWNIQRIFIFLIYYQSSGE